VERECNREIYFDHQGFRLKKAMHNPSIQVWAISGVGPKVPSNFSLSMGG